MMTKSLANFLIIPLVGCLLLAQHPVNKTDSFRSGIPEGMVLIPGGTFEMGIDKADLEQLVEMGRGVPHMSELHAYRWFGDEIPRHTVKIDSFYIDIYEVTNRQFRQFVQQTGYQAEGDWQKYAQKHRMDHPVVNVTWNDAKAYAEWAGKRLPTEEEWEYAAKGGKAVKWFPWGDSPDPARANYRHQGESFWAGVVRLIGLRKMGTKPVGSYEPNGFGLYDMCGNVSEWCENVYKPYPDGPQEDEIYTGHGLFKKSQKPMYGKAIRGGNWQSPNAVFVRITHRNEAVSSHFSNDLGFRCASSVSPHAFGALPPRSFKNSK